MKKFLLPILLFLMFIPLYVNAEACDTNKISIENIAIESKSDNVKELSQATASGKNINLNLSMSEVGDNIEYKFVVKNDSNEDYELDKTSLNISSDYIEYSFETEDDSNIVKANSSKVVFIRVNYKTEVPEDKFENGTYSDNKTMIAYLSNGQTIEVPDTIKNPNTGDSLLFFMLICILCVGITMCMVLSRKKLNKFMILLLTLMITIPTSVYAICKIEITVESNVNIVEKEQKFKVNLYACCSEFKINDEFSFKYGMTLKEWIYSDYINKIPETEDERPFVINMLEDFFFNELNYSENYIIQPGDYIEYRPFFCEC